MSVTAPTKTQCLLNIDLGELAEEDEQLYLLAHVANIACGGHAGDERSVRQALERCRRHGTRAGVHPSYVDRAGFGRQAQNVAPEVLRGQVVEQCGLLASQALAVGVPVEFAKPHGALYHAANRDPLLAQAVVSAVAEVFGTGITFIGPPTGALREAAQQAGLRYAREGFADRATLPDGTLMPRSQPGAVITDPSVARQNASRLARGGEVDTLCVHGDTPGAVSVAREARAVLDALAR